MERTGWLRDEPAGESFRLSGMGVGGGWGETKQRTERGEPIPCVVMNPIEVSWLDLGQG